MNVFVLDRSAQVAARMHCDRHVVKMIVESAQLLSTTHRLLDGNALGELPGEEWVRDLAGRPIEIRGKVCYMRTHSVHPCSRWAGASDSNYRWLWTLMMQLDLERRFRYGGPPGATVSEIGGFLQTPPRNIAVGPCTAPPQAMPDEYKCDDAVTAYRAYYLGAKCHLARWTRRGQPEWWE